MHRPAGFLGHLEAGRIFIIAYHCLGRGNGLKPIIDREISKPKPCRTRRHLSRQAIIAALIVASVTVGAIAGIAVQLRYGEVSAPSESPWVPLRILYTTHSPITISGDAQFVATASTEGWPGDGSAGNPYLISGLDINGTGHRWSICINDTRVHFELSSCLLHDGTDSGLELHNVSNAVVSNLICERAGSYGIVAVQSDSNVFMNNNCSQASYGIYLFGSSYNTIRGSTCAQQILGSALYLESSDNNMISGNEFSSNVAASGISLTASDHNYVSDNSCWWAGYGVFLGTSSHNNTIATNSFAGNSVAVQLQSSPFNMIATNTVIGVAVAAYSSNGLTIVGNDGGKIFLSDSNDCIVSNNNCSHGGISLLSSKRNTIENNTCDYVPDGADGIHVIWSDNNTIQYNNCRYNYHYGGIAIPYPDGCGIFIQSSDNNTLRNNSCLSNEGAGIEGFDCPGTVIEGNNCSFNTGMHGLTGDGIAFGSNGQRIANNTCIGNTQFGLSIYGSGFTINNLCIDNRLGGINLGDGKGTSALTSNRLVRNGIVFTEAALAIVGSWSVDTTNTVNDRPIQYLKGLVGGAVPLGAGQVILVSCSSLRVENQTLNNATIGLQMFSCSGLSIMNNTCSYNRVGILVSAVSSSTFTENAIYDNLGYGIDMQGTSNLLWNNSFARNNGAGAVYSATHIQVTDYYFNNNRWNTSAYGNFWSDWTSPDAIPPYGIVDQPYVISELINPVRDYYPLASPVDPIPPQIPEFGMPFILVILVAIVVSAREAARRVRN